MEAMIAKRYVKALTAILDTEALQNCHGVFRALKDEYANDAFSQILLNPEVSTKQQEELLLSVTAPAQSEVISNLLKLLVEKRRVQFIPAIAEALRIELASRDRKYEGTVSSNELIDDLTLESLSNSLSQRLDATVSLRFVQADNDGIKVDVDDLGVEINLSKSRLKAQLSEHILKAI